MAVKIRRELSVTKELLEQMVPELVLPEGESRDQWVLGFVNSLDQNPDSIMLMTAWKGELLAGFLVAYDTRSHIFISQMWSANGNSPRVADEMFLRVCLWAVGLGRGKILAETQRDLDAAFRRFGFTERSVMIQYDLSGFLSRVSAHAREAFRPEEEVVNG